MKVLYTMLTIALFAVLTFAAWVAQFHFTEKRNAAAASKILDQARSWRLKRTGSAEIEKLAEEYKEFSSVAGECEKACTVMIDFTSLQDKIRARNLLKIGLRPSVFRFYIYVEKEALVDVHFEQVTVLPSGKSLWFSIAQAYADDRREEGDTRRAWSQISYIKSPPPSGVALQQKYTPNITDSEWEQIMHFNFECATRLSPCTKLGDYMPVAWQQYIDWARAHHWQIQTE